MIPITILRCHIQSARPLQLGDAPGIQVYGALYEALAALYDSGDPATSRHDADSNPVAWLMRMTDNEGSGGENAARPLTIRVANTATPFFEITLYGKGIAAMPMILSALSAAGRIGVGKGRQPYTIQHIDHINPITRAATPFAVDGRTLYDLPPVASAADYQAYALTLPQDRFTVRFLSPTRIVQGERLCHEPIFRAWGQRLLERIRTLSELYADEAVWIPFRELLPQMDTVRCVHNETQWQEVFSYSRYAKSKPVPTSGFVGKAEYQGDVSALLPYLLVGQSVQVGKYAIKGNGWYQLVYGGEA